MPWDRKAATSKIKNTPKTPKIWGICKDFSYSIFSSSSYWKGLIYSDEGLGYDDPEPDLEFVDEDETVCEERPLLFCGWS